MSDDEPVTEGRGTRGRPTRAEIDLGALASNFRAVRALVGAGVRVMCVVKADAYGHGARECARRLEGEGADWFAVALPEEGIQLRDAGVGKPILCLEGFWEGQAALCVQARLTPIVFRLDTAAALDRAAREAGVVAEVHVKIDTGMNRLGVRADGAAEFAARLRDFRNIRVGGLLTHFASADEARASEFTRAQVARFASAAETFRALGHEPVVEHLSNSAATFAEPAARGGMVRPGGVLYGLWRDVLMPSDDAPPLRPVMAWRTRVALLKRVPAGETLGYGRTHALARASLIATLPVGYADGYRRELSNRGRVVVRGRFAPVVGRVSMDLTIIDVTDVPDASEDDEVTLIGADGDSAITAEDLARDAGTISYEITCGVGARVPREYKSKV
ncbi:MAG: alanine racemase [Acidobacteria bacterium]|nr:alanine racemase [Acidobacteriota bacterium]MCA1641835.1 alanine racemase [Acidobacteriota bacterium]